MSMDMYINDEYRQRHPTWDIEHSSWKARQILEIMARNGIAPGSICEIGCGAGEILACLQKELRYDCTFCGYEISPQAFALCKGLANDELKFVLGDSLKNDGPVFDVALVIDVIEHVEDYFGFLRKLRRKSHYKIFHIPLDLSVQTVLRASPLLRDRASVGHIHYFTKELALQTLKDVGYEIHDHFYTADRTACSITQAKSVSDPTATAIWFSGGPRG